MARVRNQRVPSQRPDARHLARKTPTSVARPSNSETRNSERDGVGGTSWATTWLDLNPTSRMTKLPSSPQ
eukprot:3578743-Rhodomonas_salina.1